MHVALSTMWAIGRFQNLGDFFKEGKDLGFDCFELNHAISSAMLGGLALNGWICSVHEPCPADIPAAALKERDWLISATEEKNRQEGVAAVRRSIDLAQSLGARAVIMHPGRVNIDPAYEAALIALYQHGESDQPQYAQARERIVSARAAQAQASMGAVRRSMIELAEYADRKNVRLGLENRYHYHEIPLPDELDELLDLGLGEAVGYWHDIGHAQVLQELGFFPHEDWLRRFAGRMIGVHLHDVVGITDHLAAGLGGVDWSMVANYLPANILSTCEFQSTNSPQQVAAGIEWLAGKGCI